MSDNERDMTMDIDEALRVINETMSAADLNEAQAKTIKEGMTPSACRSSKAERRAPQRI